MPTAKVLCVIPARYASTRLPGKPLVDILGKPMIEHVYKRVKLTKLVDQVLVATDDERVLHAVKSFQGQALLTSPTHLSGTDRLAEVAKAYEKTDIIINVQGDEPLIEPELIDNLCQEMLNDESIQMATVKTILARAEYDNPAAVKVVTDKKGYALYFSRSLLPYPRNEKDYVAYKHIGIYAYRRDFLLQFAALPQTYLEKVESLEQLRALENGYKIKVIETKYNCVGVDTPEDLNHVRKLLQNS